MLKGSSHQITDSSFSSNIQHGAHIHEGNLIELKNVVFGTLMIEQTNNTLFENVTVDSLIFEESNYNLLRQSNIANQIALRENSTGNRALALSFGDVICLEDSTLAIEYRTVIELRTVQGRKLVGDRGHRGQYRLV